MYMQAPSPFDEQESPEDYLNRMRFLSMQSMAHFNRWQDSLAEQEPEDVPDTAWDLYLAAIERSKEDANRSLEAIRAELQGRDPRPEEARTKWLRKKGFKGSKT